MPIAEEQLLKPSTGVRAEKPLRTQVKVKSAERLETEELGLRIAQEMIENLKRNIPENRRLIEAQIEKNRQAREGVALDKVASPVA